jgi:drug/metabolite transporter (DMT)-like permease
VAGTALVLAGTMLLQTRFQKDTAATRAAVILTAEPVFAAGFAYLLLGEAPTADQGAGAGLILAGILAVARR